MRKIKFKAFDLDIKSFFPQSDKYDFSYGIVSGQVRGIYGEKFNNIILLQYTGYEDKNGKEIYEGDIVEYFGLKLEVFFIKGCFVFGDKEKYRRDTFGCNNKDLKVIGNIYETDR